MPHDEDEIRQLVATWMSATRAGDIDTVLSLMADDAVFLVPGQAVMRKEDFAAAARARPGADAPCFEGESEIMEIVVTGEWAYMWTRLTVVVNMPGTTPARRAGHTLSVLRKQHGRWVLARDANLLAPIA